MSDENGWTVRLPIRQLRVLSIDHEELKYQQDMLKRNGIMYFRWGGFSPNPDSLPKEGDMIVIMHKCAKRSTLYLMKVQPLTAKNSDDLICDDDCCPFILRVIAGPVTAQTPQLDFLNSEPVGDWNPGDPVSQEGTALLRQLFEF